MPKLVLLVGRKEQVEMMKLSAKLVTALAAIALLVVALAGVVKSGSDPPTVTFSIDHQEAVGVETEDQTAFSAPSDITKAFDESGAVDSITTSELDIDLTLATDIDVGTADGTIVLMTQPADTQQARDLTIITIGDDLDASPLVFLDEHDTADVGGSLQRAGTGQPFGAILLLVIVATWTQRRRLLPLFHSGTTQAFPFTSIDGTKTEERARPAIEIDHDGARQLDVQSWSLKQLRRITRPRHR